MKKPRILASSQQSQAFWCAANKNASFAAIGGTGIYASGFIAAVCLLPAIGVLGGGATAL